jgi:hypothetical protein
MFGRDIIEYTVIYEYLVHTYGSGQPYKYRWPETFKQDGMVGGVAYANSASNIFLSSTDDVSAAGAESVGLKLLSRMER